MTPRMVVSAALVTAGFLVVAMACSDGSSSHGEAPAEGARVGSAGGTVTISGVTLEIPPGALSTDVTIAVSDDGVAPAGYVVQGKVYRFAPSGLRFAIPITVTLPGRPPGSMFWSEETSDERYASLPTSFSDRGATANVAHFSNGFVGQPVVEAGPTTDAGAEPACDERAWPVDRGAPGACPPSESLPSSTCIVVEESFHDLVCQTSSGPRCFDSKSDPRRCGACEIACAAGDVCLRGTCAPPAAVRFVSGLGRPEDVVVDAKNIYFTDGAKGEVWQVDKISRAATKLAANQPSPYRIAIDATHVYWTNKNGGVARAPIGGASPAEIIHPAAAPTGIAVDGTNVFFSDGSLEKGSIYKAPKDPACGAPVVLSTYASPDYLESDETRVYGYPGRCGSNAGEPSVFGIDKITGARTGYSACSGLGTGYYTGVTVDAKNVFYFDEAWMNLKLYAKDKDGGLVSEREICPAGTCIAAPYVRVVSDACGLYWSNDRSLWRLLPADTYARRIFWTSPPGTVGPAIANKVAVDDAYVYWTDADFIGRVPK